MVEGLIIKTYSSDKASTDTLVIFLHGDRCAADYMKSMAKKIAKEFDVLSIVMARPGCTLGWSKSVGRHGSKDHYTEDRRPKTEDRIVMVESAIQALKDHYQSRRVFIVGHSGGAATAGIILGHNPDLLSGAMLMAFPANIPEWRIHRRGSNSWTNSLSPHDFVGDITKSSKIMIVSGAHDVNTIPELADDYARLALKKGLNVEHIIIKGAGHNELVGRKQAIAALGKIIKTKGSGLD